MYPAVHGVLAACTPPHELGRAASLVYAGKPLTVVNVNLIFSSFVRILDTKKIFFNIVETGIL